LKASPGCATWRYTGEDALLGGLAHLRQGFLNPRSRTETMEFKPSQQENVANHFAVERAFAFGMTLSQRCFQRIRNILNCTGGPQPIPSHHCRGLGPFGYDSPNAPGRHWRLLLMDSWKQALGPLVGLMKIYPGLTEVTTLCPECPSLSTHPGWIGLDRVG
jgi:hypothetical protein